MAALIFKGGMQIQVVNSSLEKMESYLDDPDP
jgi:ribosomal protein L21